MKPLVTVVIPCLNEETYIRHCVESLLNNGYPKESLEILVADGLSEDRTREIVRDLEREHGNVRLLDNEVRITPAAMNLGIQEGRGEYLMIAGAHSSYDQGYISACVDSMERIPADVVGGMMRTEVKNETKTSLAIRAVLRHPVGVGNSMFRIGIKEARKVDSVPFGLYKRKMLQDVGGFNLRLKRNQDMEMSKRLAAHGAQIWLIPDVQATYFARETWKSFYRNNFLNGLWNIRTIQVTGKFKSIGLRHVMPVLFLASLLLPLFTAVWIPQAAYLAGISLVAYLLTILYFSFRLGAQASPFHVLWTFMVLHFSYAFGLTKGLFTMYQKV
jgi:glycosyltransferase involved in cell wall biosynthesis